MSLEFLEKIRNIIVILFVLFFSFLIMLITFCSLRVHAATVTPTGNIIAEVEGAANEYFVENIKVYSNDLQCAIYTCNVASDIHNLVGLFFTTDLTSSFKYYYSTESIWANYPQNNKTDVRELDSSGLGETTLSDGTVVRYSTGGFRNTNYTIISSTPCYDPINNIRDLGSKENVTLFLEHLLVTGDLVPNNGGSIDNPDFEDSAYAFTGFTANNKMTATWTGTTERSYLQDQEVEEYVRVNYYFADKEAQDTIKQADAYPDEFATADKTLTIDVSGLEPDNENWFLRYIRITPCYRQAGLGAWGDFYHGEPSYVYFNQDGSIDRIDAPFIKGELSSDMERPVIVLHEAANGNPTESDYSYFEFNNAQSDYFFEMKGRWYTTNDFDLYRDKLVWKYKYSTLLKNNLSTWVSVSDNRSSVGRFQFDVLGKSSWDNLLSSYPVDDRNYIGGSYDLFNKITGYSDALETLKMLLKQPYSLFNGYEVYVRYFRFDENGGIQYSKWTHFYNNLADSEGSSGSRLDDLDNMYSENQSDKGLTDDELSDLEDGGNSRNDLDAVPKNNYDYSSLENATMNFFDLLTNFGTMLGQFPSMVAAVFSFLPSWLIGLIAVAIGAVIFCRFIGR